MDDDRLQEYPTATPLKLSTRAWLMGAVVGGVLGAVCKKDHRVLGALGGTALGAIVVGTIADKTIDCHYAPLWRATGGGGLMAPSIGRSIPSFRTSPRGWK